MTDTQPGTDISVVAKKVEDGEILSLDLLLKAVAKQADLLPAPAKVPLPAVITEAQSEALDRLVEVFGSVQPTERRALEPAEGVALMDERETLDEIEKLAKTRKESIRTAVMNHFDVVLERDGGWPEHEQVFYDKDGHYVREGEFVVPEKAKKFTREVRNISPSLSEADLKKLEQDGDIDHETYLSMTDQVRVLNENKVMIAIQKNPALLGAIQKATRPGGKTAALNVRKV